MQYDPQYQYVPVIQPPPQKKRNKPIALFILSASVAVIILLITVFAILLSASHRYGQAISRLESGDYAGALRQLEGVWPPVGDTASLKGYAKAGAAMREGKYDEAKSLFDQLGGFRNSKVMILEADYLAASDLLEKGDYAGARKAFEALSQADYKNFLEMMNEADYRSALDLLMKKDYIASQKAFKALGAYKDSPGKLANANEGIYQSAVESYKKADYKAAASEFALIDGYKDEVWKYQYLIEARSITKDDSRYDYAKTKKAYDNLAAVGDFEDAKALKLSDAFITYYLEGDWMINNGNNFFAAVFYDSARKVWFLNDDALDKYHKMENGSMYIMNTQYKWIEFFKVTYLTDDSSEWYFISAAAKENLTRSK